MKQVMLQVTEHDEAVRIDSFLALHIPDKSRSYLQKLIKEKALSVNGREVKANYIVKEGDVLRLDIPENVLPDILPENIPLSIIYEDGDLVVVNKGKDMVVHPAPGHYTGTLVNALLYHCREDLSGINGILRPGIVHRIDKDTTGLLVACKNDLAHECIAAQLKEHSITRAYRALVHGRLGQEEGVICAPIGRSRQDRKKMCVDSQGREAITHYKVLERFASYTYVECRLETGRTHQIRVHMASLGHPLLGDPLYSTYKEKFHLQGQCLHAMTLGFLHPRSRQYMLFKSELPEYFEKLLQKLPK